MAYNAFALVVDYYLTSRIHDVCHETLVGKQRGHPRTEMRAAG